MALLKLSVQQFIERGITVLFEGLEEEHQVDSAMRSAYS
jgi:hypothetical protein